MGRGHKEEDVRSYWMTLKETRRYWNLKEVLDRTVCRTVFGSGYGPVLRQTTG